MFVGGVAIVSIPLVGVGGVFERGPLRSHGGGDGSVEDQPVD